MADSTTMQGHRVVGQYGSRHGTDRYRSRIPSTSDPRLSERGRQHTDRGTIRAVASQSLRVRVDPDAVAAAFATRDATPNLYR